jgi:hypothetical protein
MLRPATTSQMSQLRVPPIAPPDGTTDAANAESGGNPIVPHSASEVHVGGGPNCFLITK